MIGMFFYNQVKDLKYRGCIVQRLRSGFSISRPGFDSWLSQKLFKVAEIYQCSTLEESGQKLYNFNHTHLASTTENYAFLWALNQSP